MLQLKIIWSYLIFSIITTQLHAQTQTEPPHKKNRKIGLNYGKATQSFFPFNNANYIYNTEYYKVQISSVIASKNKFKLEYNIEPSLYTSEHQLLNPHFIQSKHGKNYLEQRDTYTEKRVFKEYVLNLGLTFKYEIAKKLAPYLLISIGPLFSDADTERLKKGFAFSDIVGAGLSYNLNTIYLDLRLTLRHNSNASLFTPNMGHNSIGIESGISFQL